MIFSNKNGCIYTLLLILPNTHPMSRIKPLKSLGQVFLNQQGILKKMIQAAELKDNEKVLEIGPGKGILTSLLLDAKVEVIAIEKDKRLISFLQNKFLNHPQLTLINDDILNLLNDPLRWKQLKIGKKYKIVANIPYYLTSRLLRLFLEMKNKPQMMVLIIQKEVAQRITAQAPKTNLLAISVQFYAQPKIICFVPKTAFWPKPKVDSAIIKILPFSTVNNTDPTFRKKFFSLVKAGFKQPRKLLFNNLLYYFGGGNTQLFRTRMKTTKRTFLKGDTLPLRNGVFHFFKIEKSILKDIFEKLKIPLQARAENLTLAQWLSLVSFHSFFTKKNIV